ncbi:MAG: phosphate ABC transporter permease subunit PstC [Thermoleophilia bacterium]
MRRPLAGLLADRGYVAIVVAVTAAALATMGYLLWQVLDASRDAWSAFGVWGFLSGTDWLATPVTGEPLLGALPFIYGTLVTSAIALAIAVPLAVGVALATTVFLPRRLRGPVAAVVDLLAAVPSVVYGLWGLLVLVPALTPALRWIADHNGPFGFLEGPVTISSYLVSGLVLALMVLPIVAAITREVLLTVPPDQQEAAYALGATRWEMVRSAMLPWARSGIVGASALGLGRAVGETIAIALLLGNTPNIWGSLLGPGATMASAIALEFASATSGLHASALCGLAVVLFMLSLVINVLARILVSRGGRGPGPLRRALGGRAPRRAEPAAAAPEPPPAPAPPAPGDAAPPRVPRGRRVRSGIAAGLVYAALAISLVPLGFILGEIVSGGIAAAAHPGFYTELPPADPFTEGGGISAPLVGTLIMMGLATAFSVPVGILMALFVNQVAASGNRALRQAGAATGFVVDLLLGVPSIVVGLMVYLVVVVRMGGFSALAGAIALAVVMLPIVVRSTEEILRLVPGAQIEAALALGAPRWRTTWSVILPAALPGIVTGSMLALARAAGETAPLLFTAGGWQFFSTDVMAPIAALPLLIFRNMIEVRTPQSEALAWGAALVLVGIILLLNIVARFIATRSRTLESR